MEIIFEVLFEVLLEIILTLLGKVLEAFAIKVESNSLLRKTLKFGFKYTVLGLTVILITLSLIHRKGFLVIIAVSYMLAILLISMIASLNKDVWKNKRIYILIEIFRRIVHYTYPILLIVFGSIYLTNSKARNSIIIISVIGIIAWFSIDMFRIWRKDLYKKRKKFEESKEKNIDLYS